jgi:predicted MFS family arabinose efflux permease
VQDALLSNTATGFSNAYKRYVLAVLTSVYLLNLLDRVLMGLLLEPIKHELHLSDTQLGFLTGIAFGLFYATLGLPIARWADRGNRTLITSLAIGLWGVTVMTCFFVTNFIQLLLARIFAAVGEAGCVPPTSSLLGDYFVEAGERARAMAIYMSGSALAAIVGFIAGGWLNEAYGWRVAFFVIGIPGLVLAILVYRTIAEPRSTAASRSLTKHAPPVPPIRAVMSYLWQQRALRHLSIAVVLTYTLGLGLSPWYAAFMMRAHGMSTAELGLWFAVIFGLGGVAGGLLGGQVAKTLLAGRERAQMRMSAVAIAAMLPCYVAFLIVPSKTYALAALVPLAMIFSVFLGPTFALMQRLVADEMRATTMALVMLIANLIGMGLGPQIVGAASDLLIPLVQSRSLSYAMLLMSFLAPWAAYHFWQVGTSVQQDLAQATQRRRDAERASVRLDVSRRGESLRHSEGNKDDPQYEFAKR